MCTEIKSCKHTSLQWMEMQGCSYKTTAVCAKKEGGHSGCGMGTHCYAS